MSLKADVPIHVKSAATGLLEAPAQAATSSEGVPPTKPTKVRQAKSVAQLEIAQEDAEPQASAQTFVQQEPTPVAESEEGRVVLAASDPSWYVEPGSTASATDAPKPNWLLSPVVPETVPAEPIVGAAIDTTKTTPVPTTSAPGPALSGMGLNALGIGAGLLGLGLAGGGGGGTGGGGSAALKASTSTIKVVDGPIHGAKVYVDMNDNGIVDQGDRLIGTTDASGSLVVTTDSLAQHGLLAAEGTNDNGMPNASTLSLAALSDKSYALVVLSPLTSLVSAVYLKSLKLDSKANFQSAETLVKSALGLDNAVLEPLSTLDPTSAGTTGLQLLKVGAMLASLAAVPQSISASGQDSLASFILSKKPAGGALLTLLASKDDLQTVFASSLDTMSSGDRASALTTLGTLATNNKNLLVATNTAGLSFTQIAKPQILGLVQDTGPSASDKITSLSQLTVSALGGNTELSVDKGSTWFAASSFAPADGFITVIARSNYGINSEGKLVVSGSSDPFTFTLHATVPPAPTITLVQDTNITTDHITSDGRYTVAANQVDGGVVQYSTGGRIWSPTVSLQDQATLALDGLHTVYVRQVVLDSGLSSAVNRLDFALDTHISAGKAYVLSADDSGALYSDGITNIPQARLAGDTDPNNTVELALPSGAIFKVLADTSGHWVFDPSTKNISLKDGLQAIDLRISDAAGNSAKAKLPLSVDTQLDLGTAFIEGASAESAVTHKVAPTLRGTTTEIGASVDVSLQLPVAGGAPPRTLVFHTTTDAQGNWSVVLDTPGHTGLVVPTAEQSYDYSPQVTITDLAGNSDYGSLADFTLALGPDPAIGGLDVASDTGAAHDDGITSNATPFFSGTAVPGASLAVLIDGKEFVTDVVVGGDGKWSCEAPMAIPKGEHQLTFSVTVARGAGAGTTVSVPQVLVIDKSKPDEVSVVPGAMTSDAAFGTDGDGVMYFNAHTLNKITPLTFSGTADLGAKVELRIADTLVDTVTASIEDGSWSFAWDGLVAGKLPADGRYTASLVVTDLAGNVSQSTLPASEEGKAFVIDTTPPDTATLKASLDATVKTGADPDTGEAYTKNNDVTVVGVADPLTTLVVSVDGQEYDVTPGSDGSWSLDLTGLRDGNYPVYIVAKDLAGNASKPLEALVFNVDTVPEFFSGSAELGYGPTIGTHLSTLVVGTDKSMDINPFAILSNHTAPGAGYGYADSVEVLGTLADGLALGANGHITGTPSSAGQTWLAIHSFDYAGNESITDVQLAVSISATASSSAKLTVSGAMAKQYTGSDIANTINITASAGVVVYAAGGEDTINIGSTSIKSSDVPFVRIDGGAGILDTVSLAYKGESIDLSNFNNPDGSGGVLEHVEQFKLAGGSGTESSITLTAADVFHLHSDATLNDNALLILSALSSASNGYLTANLSDDFTQVGDSNKFSITGDAVSKAAVANYSQFHGIYTDYLGQHDVTVLVQGYFVLG